MMSKFGPNSTQMTLAEKIARERQYTRAERTIRAIRLKIFEYEDDGKLEKAHRVIAACKARLQPLYEARAHAAQEEKYRNYMM